MNKREKNVKRRILAVFSHPDDETTSSGGTLTRYAREGVEIHVVTATRGEKGALGTRGLVIRREDLPAVRQAELEDALRMFGAQPPIILGYRDQELANADFGDLVAKLLEILQRVTPDVVITWGPSGISRHEDHVAVHRAMVEAFHRYRNSSDVGTRLFYVAIPKGVAEQFELTPDDSETSPTVAVDISEVKAVKIRALRSYRSQEDAQQIADFFEASSFEVETFHQAFPPVADDRLSSGFWE